MKKVKFDVELPLWALIIIYILECTVFGVLLGVIIGYLLS